MEAAIDDLDAAEDELLEALESSLTDTATKLGDVNNTDAQDEGEDVLAALEIALMCAVSDDEPASSSTTPLADVPAAQRRRLDSTLWPPQAEASALAADMMQWPMEVRLCVASYVAWGEMVRRCSLLCQSWRILESHDALWQVYFQSTWPRLSRRRDVRVARVTPWRSMFQNRWAEANRSEDALEEDWLDFNAAQDSKTSTVRSAQEVVDEAEATAAMDRLFQAQLEAAIRQLREDLQVHGVQVPAEPDTEHACSSQCRFHQLLEHQDAYLCEASGLTHNCGPRDSISDPCQICVLSADDHFLVCPASGRCFTKTFTAKDEAALIAANAGLGYNADAAENVWDPAMGAAQQIGMWFEQGYSMSEEQARDFFGETEAGDSLSPRMARLARMAGEAQRGNHSKTARRRETSTSVCRSCGGR